MTPVRTPECNFTYLAPKGVTGCDDLPCLRQEGSTTSFWKPDARELAHLCAGGTVALTCFGKGHPVVGLGVMPAEQPTDIHDVSWQREFVVPAIQVMKMSGIESVTIHITADGGMILDTNPPAGE